jgi:hypothetical protein
MISFDGLADMMFVIHLKLFYAARTEIILCDHARQFLCRTRITQGMRQNSSSCV